MKNRYQRKTFPKTTKDENKDLIKKLRFKIHGMEKEINILKSQIKQLNKALNKSLDRVDALTDHRPLEKILEDIDNE